MRTLMQKFAAATVVALALSLAPQVVFAATPYLTVTSQGGDNVQISVSGADRNAQVNLKYRSGNSSLWTTVSNIGTTDWNGYFTSGSISLGSNSYNAEVVVTVNGQDSATARVGGGSNCYYGSNCYGCTYNCGSGSVSLSQTSLSMTTGQSQSVSIYQNTGYYGSTSYYVSSNSNSSVASASISGSTLNLYASQNGSTTITVCSGSSTCATLYVSVSGSTYCNGSYNSNCYGNGSISLSQTSLSMTSGQSQSVTVYQNSSYQSAYISSNSNSSVASASISGSVISIYASQNGSTTITVCGGSSSCATLYVTVTGSTYCNGSYSYNCSGGLTLSQTSVSLNASQNSSITISQNGGYYNQSYYVSSNSNSSVASASVSGSVLSIYGIQNGSTTVTVCGSSSQCASVYVTVSGNYCNGSYGNCGSTGSLYLSPSSINLSSGQSSSVSISGGTYYNQSYYISSNSNSSVVSASISGSTVVVYGSQTGSATVSVCGGGASQCASLYVTVNGYTNNGGSVLGSSINSNGQLISENNTVYIVYRGMRIGFANRAAFDGFGFKFANVRYGSSGLPASGYTIRTSKASHPWGSWVKNGNTVFFVHEQGLIAVPAYDVFQNNGGEDRLVVAANAYDLSLPVLSVMTFNDYRLR